MSCLWPQRRPPRGSVGGSLFTPARAMTSGQLMMSSFCQRERNTSSPWPTQHYHRSETSLLLSERQLYGILFLLVIKQPHTDRTAIKSVRKSLHLSAGREKRCSALICLLSLQNFYEKPAFDYPLNQMSVWLMLGNEGMERESNDSFCAPTPSAMVFGRSDGDRVAVTRDLALRHGYTLQFKVSPSEGSRCSSPFKVVTLHLFLLSFISS